MRHTVTQQYRFRLRKITVVEYEHELATVGIETLNRGRKSWRKEPKIVFVYVGDETFTVQVDRRKPCRTVKHDGPFAGRVPMQLAESAGSQSHVDASHSLGDGKLPYRYLA